MIGTTFLSSFHNIVLIFSSIRAAFSTIYKNIAFIFSLVKTVSFYFFCFGVYTVEDGEYSTGNYKYPKTSIGKIMKNSELLKSSS